MKAYRLSLAIALIAAAPHVSAFEMPLLFARSGRQVTLRIAGGSGAAVLWAHDHVWGGPMTFENGAVEIAAPRVRVPVVFQVVSGTQGLGGAAMRLTLGELIVYPDQPMRWDKDTQLAAVDVPEWFNLWADAVGLPVRKFKRLKSLDMGGWRVPEKPSLMILGGKAIPPSPASAWPIADQHGINVLVLDPDWFDRNEANTGHKVTLSPKQMAGPLSGWRNQDWPMPPVFRRRFLYIANRQTWIAGAEHPLVEELCCPTNGAEHWRTVFSYLPWQSQLGRCEMADVLFLRLLSEATKGAKGRPALNARWRLLYPPLNDVKPAERPVLAGALNAIAADQREAASGEVGAYVLDLRGKASPPADLFDEAGTAKTVEARIGAQSPLLILGDHPALDTWKWLELDRTHHKSPRPGVLWWPDSSLPPSTESQLRLMQLFTEWNISLGDAPQEASNEDRKNGR